MANVYARLNLPVQRVDNGFMRPVAGASVYVYATLADGSSPVNSDGSVNVGATLVSLYNNRSGSISTTNPLVSDASGYISCFAQAQELHFRVVALDGTSFGMAYYNLVGNYDKEDFKFSTRKEIYTDQFIIRSETDPSQLLFQTFYSAGTITYYLLANIFGFTHPNGTEILTIDTDDLTITTGIGVKLDLAANVLGTLRIPIAAPVAPESGMLYFNTVTNELFCYNGTAWKKVTLT